MSKENMSLWNKVYETDRKHTKTVGQRGGFTSIDAQYILKRATEELGPYGSGFGLESIDLDFTLIETSGLVIVKAVFFYVLDGKRHNFPIINSWPLKMGAKFDPEFAKKAETNTVSKALSKLGFCADVYMGDHDDQEYVDMLNNKQALKDADDKEAEILRQAKIYDEKCAYEIEALNTATNQNELKKLFTHYTRNTTKDPLHVTLLTKAKDRAKARLGIEEAA